MENRQALSGSKLNFNRQSVFQIKRFNEASSKPKLKESLEFQKTKHPRKLIW